MSAQMSQVGGTVSARTPSLVGRPAGFAGAHELARQPLPFTDLLPHLVEAPP